MSQKSKRKMMKLTRAVKSPSRRKRNKMIQIRHPPQLWSKMQGWLKHMMMSVYPYRGDGNNMKRMTHAGRKPLTRISNSGDTHQTMCISDPQTMSTKDWLTSSSNRHCLTAWHPRQLGKQIRRENQARLKYRMPQGLLESPQGKVIDLDFAEDIHISFHHTFSWKGFVLQRIYELPSYNSN